MTALALTFADFSRTLQKFTRVPLAQDFFEWCEQDEWKHLRWTLSTIGLSFTPSEPLSDFKARVERKLEQEISKGERKHWSFCPNRLVTWRQLLRAIEKFTVTECRRAA